MAARSTQVILVNDTGFTLSLTGSDLSHGEWSSGAEPPGTIGANSTVSWQSESDGIATGTEGTADFDVVSTGASLHFHWDNPFVGSNSYDEKGPIGLTLERSGGGGDNATVTWVLSQTAGFWGQLRNQPPVAIGPCWLLTDGRVFAKQEASANCWTLTPDQSGDYSNGTWKQVAGMTGDRRYFASGVLANGKLLVCGGEYYNGAKANTNLCEIYDPVADSWAVIAPPATPAKPPRRKPTPWPAIGDASSVVLANGQFMMGNINTPAYALFDPATQAFTVSPNAKNSRCDEETWVLMPDGNVLTIETNSPPNTESYNPAVDTWSATGTTGPSVITAGAEIGPGLALPDGRGLIAGGTGTLAFAASGANPAWTLGVSFPPDENGLPHQPKDAPACLLPSGDVLFAVAPNDQGSSGLPAGIRFFLFDPAPTVYDALGSPWRAVPSDSVPTSGSAFNTAMLMLPTGQVLLTFSQDPGQPALYTPAGTPQPPWRPVIDKMPRRIKAGSTIQISGRQFNGLSQCSVYGDDVAVATNYPVARVLLRNGRVRYLRTHDHSTMGVATGPVEVTTNVDIPADLPRGTMTLQIVANGIASVGTQVSVVKG
jgi:Kelch motif